MKKNKVKESLHKLELYCEKNDYKGYDPFDGLNSKIFQQTPFKNSRFFRLAWLQLFKRSPINFRRITRVEKSHNSKAVALFLIGFVNSYEIKPSERLLNKIESFTELLIKLKSQGYDAACWGYNFDWQARAFFQPKFTPTIVATSFIIESLCKANKILKSKEVENVILSSADFIFKDLNKTYDSDGNFTLSYSPIDNTQVFNAGLLGAKTLCYIYHIDPQKKYLDFAQKIVKYVCNEQNKDGSWAYSKKPYHQWIDSFHTGYNLECLYKYIQISDDYSFKASFDKGFKFYINNFFLDDGTPKYYHNQTYPVDILSPSQLIITLYKTDKLDEYRHLADKVLNWSIDHMQSKKGYFYYQKKKYYTIKLPYMRWTQSWMFLAFSYYLKYFRNE